MEKVYHINIMNRATQGYMKLIIKTSKSIAKMRFNDQDQNFFILANNWMDYLGMEYVKGIGNILSSSTRRQFDTFRDI